MRYEQVNIAGLGYELPAQVVTSRELEARLGPVYARLHLKPGQFEALTGIRERRWWPAGQTMAAGAIAAGRKALAASGVPVEEIGAVIYGAVCRDNLEPATACEVADGLGIGKQANVYDVSNACLAVINGIMQAANAIELGQIRAGLVVACESAREIVEITIGQMLEARSIEDVRLKLATLTGGSGAIGVVVAHASLVAGGRRVIGGVARNDTSHHGLCRWGPATGVSSAVAMEMATDATAVLEHGVALGVETWGAFLEAMDWSGGQVDRTIMHQVGAPHRDTMLAALGIPPEKDFQTYEYLGNIGTVSLPITAAIAEERGVLERGQRVAFCGIGSGLNCLMLGVEW